MIIISGFNWPLFHTVTIWRISSLFSVMLKFMANGDSVELRTCSHDMLSVPAVPVLFTAYVDKDSHAELTRRRQVVLLITIDA